MDYRAYLLDEHGQIIDALNFAAPTDQAAVIHAFHYANGRDVEIWQRSRRVGFIPREPKSVALDEPH
jgi:hypothetical protein